jgi:phosphoglycolate phosphatase-like HAD superfamily hydrolase
MQEQNTPTIVVFDLDNTVWYGNYQRHGYLLSELLYRLKNTIHLNAPIRFPFQQFLVGWNAYTACLHLTAPQQLDLLFDHLVHDGFLQFAHEKERESIRQVCVEWMENKYWELVSHPDHFYIAEQAFEYGRRVCLVPGIKGSLSFLRQQRTKRKLKIYATSLNLQHISEKILMMLEISDIFDEVFGVTWNGTSSTKEEFFQQILQMNHANSNQAITIGDAVGDIITGKKVGAKTVAIATGPTTYLELLASQPDEIIQQWPENLEEIEQIFSL